MKVIMIIIMSHSGSLNTGLALQIIVRERDCQWVFQSFSLSSSHFYSPRTTLAAMSLTAFEAQFKYPSLTNAHRMFLRCLIVRRAAPPSRSTPARPVRI